MHGMGVFVDNFRLHLHDHHSLESIVEMVAMAPSGTVSNIVGIIRTNTGLSGKNVAMKRVMVRLLNHCRQAGKLFLSQSSFYYSTIQGSCAHHLGGVHISP
jgi:hypothetical protein